MVLAAGLGTRMRRVETAADLSVPQRGAAARGLKAMIPVGRPFLDHVLSGLADAGYSRVCLVIGAGEAHSEIRRYYSGPGRPARIALEFAVQRWPLGTADAVLAAEPFAGGEPVVVLNADNLYPRPALTALGSLPRAGLVGFRRSSLIREGNIPADRITAFALIEVDGDGELSRIIEKPNLEEAASFGEDPLVSMNAWLLPPTIYAACRAIRPSPRGELELQGAVRHSIERLGERYRVIPSDEGVLDLSTPEDIAAVTTRLGHLEARP